MAITLNRPAAADQVVTIPANKEEKEIVLSFPLTDAAFERQGDNLVLSFGANEQIVIENFYTEYTGDDLPDFTVDGATVLGKDFFEAFGDAALMPEAGPAGPEDGGRFYDYGDPALAQGVDALGKVAGGSEYGRFGAIDPGEITGMPPAPGVTVVWDNPVTPPGGGGGGGTEFPPNVNAPSVGATGGWVTESGLAAGTRAGQEDYPITATGTATITAPGGVAAITVTVGENTAVIPAGGGSVILTDGERGEFEFTMNPDGTVTYTYTLTDAAEHPEGDDPQNWLEEGGMPSFEISVTDNYGQTSPPVTTTVQILDDVPEVSATGGTVYEGSVITGDWTMVEGADGATATVVFDGEEYAIGTEIKTDYGTLVVNEGGTWSLDTTNIDDAYIQGNRTVDFIVRVTDGDGDVVEAPVTVMVRDDADVTTVELSGTRSVEEDASTIDYTVKLVDVDGNAVEAKADVTVTLSNGATVVIAAGTSSFSWTASYNDPDVYIEDKSVELAVTNATQADPAAVGAFEHLAFDGTVVTTNVTDTIDTTTATASVAEQGADVVVTVKLTNEFDNAPPQSDVVVKVTVGGVEKEVIILKDTTSASITFTNVLNPDSSGATQTVNVGLAVDNPNAGNFEKLVAQGGTFTLTPPLVETDGTTVTSSDGTLGTPVLVTGYTIPAGFTIDADKLPNVPYGTFSVVDSKLYFTQDAAYQHGAPGSQTDTSAVAGTVTIPVINNSTNGTASFQVTVTITDDIPTLAVTDTADMFFAGAGWKEVGTAVFDFGADDGASKQLLISINDGAPIEAKYDAVTDTWTAGKVTIDADFKVSYNVAADEEGDVSIAIKVVDADGDAVGGNIDATINFTVDQHAVSPFTFIGAAVTTTVTLGGLNSPFLSGNGYVLGDVSPFGSANLTCSGHIYASTVGKVDKKDITVDPTLKEGDFFGKFFSTGIGADKTSLTLDKMLDDGLAIHVIYKNGTMYAEDGTTVLSANSMVGKAIYVTTDNVLVTSNAITNGAIGFNADDTAKILALGAAVVILNGDVDWTVGGHNAFDGFLYVMGDLVDHANTSLKGGFAVEGDYRNSSNVQIEPTTKYVYGGINVTTTEYMPIVIPMDHLLTNAVINDDGCAFTLASVTLAEGLAASYTIAIVGDSIVLMPTNAMAAPPTGGVSFSYVLADAEGHTVTGDASVDVSWGASANATDAGYNYMYGTAVDNVLAHTGSGDVVIYGGAGDDTLTGGSGDDFLFGGDGNDILIGGGGNDTLTGGAGDDIFVIGAQSGTTTITDFNVNEDMLDLTAFKSTDYTITVEASATATEITITGNNDFSQVITLDGVTSASNVHVDRDDTTNNSGFIKV